MEVKKLTSIGAMVLALAGCSERMTAIEEEPLPPNTRKLHGGGGHVTWVVPIRMEDGTRCVLVFGNSAGRGLACDFNGAR